ncbi:MAG: response regulator transcription factor, partial [SAR202 cluster bacterium]|nr:response regulator transcription factor [SAR202 cluster bacterium]
ILEMRWPGTDLLAAEDGRSGFDVFSTEHPDLVFLDLNLPDVDGLTICQRIRKNSAVPVIILTVKSQDVDIAKGLEAGADAFITKPFKHVELLARVQALLRRSETAPIEPTAEDSFFSRDVQVHFTTHEVRVKERPIRLTTTEFGILKSLVKHAGHVVTLQALSQAVWGADARDAARQLRVHVQHLRQKLGDDFLRPRYIATEWRVGYRFLQAPLSPHARPAEEIQAESA